MISEELNGWRKTEQRLLPDRKPATPDGEYDIYPSFNAGDGKIMEGFEKLASMVKNYKCVIIDGYGGVFYNHFQEELDTNLKSYGKNCTWLNMSDFLKPSQLIDELISPFIGEDDLLFGNYTTLHLKDFYDMPRLKEAAPNPSADISFIIGPGATLAGWKGLTLYLDLPKNEIQFRSRAGSITNLGASKPANPKEMYKRFYFVDWLVLNRHKQNILTAINIIVDIQRPENPVWMPGETLKNCLSEMGRNVFRVRPWFEPGAWGGQWIKDHIKGLAEVVPNYAWSFELITPENGLLFESSGRLMEISFDFLMYQESKAVLGDCHGRFGTNFPIRFDFLDTFNGGNLSIQCHPCPDYMKKYFGGDFTQEETYYILDRKDDATVYLGFQEGIDPIEFRRELEKSYNDSEHLHIEKYVQKHTSSKHDLFLIPSGTIHGSGRNNLVLEISSTPYIFTFKMYDWLRPDLDGKPRTLNIQRGMDNLCFDRNGRYVREKLISKPVLIDRGNDWTQWHLPTHETHLYDIHRYHFTREIEIQTGNKCHVLSLVEGSCIVVETSNGKVQKLSYAETFIIPAAAGKCRIINRSDGEAIVVKAFVK